MATSEDRARMMMGLPPLAASTVPAATGLSPFLNAMGIADTALVEEEDEVNPIVSFGAGLLSGVLSPASVLPDWAINPAAALAERVTGGRFNAPSGREMLAALDPYKGDSTAGKIGHGLGFVAGSFIPGGIFVKAGTGVVKAASLRGIPNLLKTADGVTELTRTGQFLQGGVAGALFGAGSPVPEESTRARQILQEAAFGGVLDVALTPLFRALSGSKAVGEPAEEVVQAVRAGVIETPEAAVVASRSENLISQIFENTHAAELPEHELGTRMINLRLGIDELGVTNLNPGQVRIVPNVGANPDDMRRVLANMPEVNYAVAERTIEGKRVTDYLVAPRGTLDREVIEQFRKQGFVSGQDGLWAGKRYVLTRPDPDPKYVWGVSADASGKQTRIPRAELSLGDVVNPILKTDKLSNPQGLWSDFVAEHGPMPEGGFSAAFNAFTESRVLTPGQRTQLKLFFYKRQKEALREVDSEVVDVLEAQAKVKLPEHPEGSFEELVASKGMITETVPMEVTRKNRKTGKKETKMINAIGLREVNSGRLHGPFANKRAASAAAKTIDVPMQDLLEDTPIASEAFGMVQRGASHQRPHTAMEISNVKMPWHVAVGSKILPRAQIIRDASDAILRQFPDAPNFWAEWMEVVKGYQEANRVGHLYKDRLTKIRGGFGKSNIRPEKYEAVVDLLETPAEARATLIAEQGLTQSEVKVADEMRKLFDELFVYGKEKGVFDKDIDGTQFIENYFPHIRRHSIEDWPTLAEEALKRRYGKDAKLSNMTREFVHEMERTGAMKKYEKDPFMVTLGYINGLMEKIHVQEAWDRAAKTIDQIPADPELPIAPLRNSLVDYMLQQKGQKAQEVFGATRALASLSKHIGMELDEGTFNRWVANAIIMNHGAFMGFRPAKALMNATQPIVTGLPILGAKHLSVGFKRAMSRGGTIEPTESGAILTGYHGVPLSDVLSTEAMVAKLGGGLKGLPGKTLENVRMRGVALAEASLGKPVEVGGRQIRLGGYALADDFTRSVMYHGQKSRSYEVNNLFQKGKIDRAEFDRRIGLDWLGESAKQEFHKLYQNGKNAEEAIRWLSVKIADDTMWMYQRGTGPAWMANSAGRLFGMYGTWPSWYLNFLKNGATRGSAADRARFVAWTAAVHGALVAASYETGVNIQRWGGIGSIEWAGGPMWEKVKDITTIWGGVRDEGKSTVERSLALSKYGIREDQTMHQWNPARYNLGPDPATGAAKLGMQTIGMFTPGLYAARDLMQAMEATSPAEAALLASGFDLMKVTSGLTYPKVVLK